MTAVQFAFHLSAFIILASAGMVVMTKKVLHAALWLVVALFGVAMLFATLQASFFAVVQVLVYIGAIAILVIFATMLTRKMMQDPGEQLVRSWWAAALASLGVFGGLVWLLRGFPGFQSLPPDLAGGSDAQAIVQLGQALVAPDGYVLPFEVASVLLLAALVGSIFIALPKKQ